MTVAPPRLHLNQPLSGRWLAVGRGCWLAVAAATLLMLILGSVNIYQDFSHVCTPVRQPECLALQDLGLEGLSEDGLAVYALATVFLIAVPWLLTGWLVFLRMSTTVAGLLMSLGLATGWASDLCTNNIRFNFFAVTSQLPYLLPVGSALTFGVGFISQVTVIVLIYLIPDGLFITHWSVWLTALWMVHALINTLYRYPFEQFAGWPFFAFLNDWLALFGPLTAVAVFGFRYTFVARGLHKLQLKAVLPSAVALAVVYTFFSVWTTYIWSGQDTETFTTLRFASHFVQSGVQSAVAAWFAVSVGIAIFRYNLFGVDLVLSRTLVYAALTLGLLAGYLLVVLGLGRLVGMPDSFWLSLLATAFVTLLFQPLRERLTKVVNRLLYGERSRPTYEVLARLSHQPQDALEARDLLPSVAQTVQRMLKLPYVGILIEAGPRRQAARVGEAGLEVKRFPLANQEEVFGWLEVSLSPGEVLDGAEHKLLLALAEQIALVSQSLRLAAELQEARQQLVSLREEERRRLRRDLHDGLGSALASQTLVVGAARRLLKSDTVQADRLLGRLEGDIQATLAQVRHLVYSLRPPDLDQLGLVGAIRHKAATLAQGHLRLELVLPDDSITYPAAVEVAAYHIVSEALTNILKHAQAQTCKIELSVRGAGLELVVADDGVGFKHGAPGVGLTAMRERAEELGGRFSALSLPGRRGTHVRALLPWAADEALTASKTRRKTDVPPALGETAP